MTRLPSVSGTEVVRALERLGFVRDRQTGSHVILYHPGPPSRMVSVPVHSNRDLPKGTLKNILRAAQISKEELIAVL